MSRSKILPPGYTQIPNVYLDEIARALTLAENLCLLHIMRETFGWHRTRHPISLGAFMDTTGLKRRTVCDALLELERRAIIRRTPHTDPSGGSTPSEYELIVESSDCPGVGQAQGGVRPSAPPPRQGGVRPSAPPPRQGGVRPSAPPESPQAHPPHESIKKESENKVAKKAAAASVPESGAKGGAARAAGAAARPAAAASQRTLPEPASEPATPLLPIPDAPPADEMGVRALLLSVPDLAADVAADLARQARAERPPYAPAEIERMLARGRKSAKNLAAFVRWAIQRGERFPVVGSARASPEPAPPLGAVPPPGHPGTAREAKAGQAAAARVVTTRAYVQDLRASETGSAAAAAEEAEARAALQAMKQRFAAEEAARRGGGRR